MATTSTQTGTDTQAKARKKKRSTKARVTATANGGRRKTARARSNGMAAELYRQGRDAVSGAYESGLEMSRAVPKLGKKLHIRSRGQSVYSMMEERPLVMGAVGLGVGMVLATLLPSMSRYGRNRHYH
jgi:hypothetical protein